MGSEEEFKRSLDSFIEEMRSQRERTFSFVSWEPSYGQISEAMHCPMSRRRQCFKHFGDHYDLRRWPFAEPRWPFIDGEMRWKRSDQTAWAAQRFFLEQSDI
jgi:hypothetical protein